MLAPSFRRTSVLALTLLPLLAVVACETGGRDARAPTPMPSVIPVPVISTAPAVATPSSTATAVASASALPCERRGQRRFGTACCEAPEGHERRMPGQAILSCRGPRIGSPCTRKGDCDIACFCQGNQNGPELSSDSGPASGATGLTGVCGGTLWAGAWMCQIDEAGKVTRIIID